MYPGEDVHLTSQLAKYMVLGMQGGPNGSYLTLNTSVIAEPKHFAAHSIPECGINTSPVHLGMYVLCMYVCSMYVCV
jgi:beta-glucosidase